MANEKRPAQTDKLVRITEGDATKRGGERMGVSRQPRPQSVSSPVTSNSHHGSSAPTPSKKSHSK
jgi:hypothetical protein